MECIPQKNSKAAGAATLVDRIMLAKFKKQIITLAVLAVVVVQFFGVSAGFMCGCTGDVSAEPVCVTTTCHPENSNARTSLDSGDSAVASDASSGKALDQNSQPEDSPDHQHSEIRKALILAGVPPVLASPSVVYFDLLPSFQLPDLAVLNTPSEEQACPAPPEYGSPPAPEMVARTIVLLV